MVSEPLNLNSSPSDVNYDDDKSPIPWSQPSPRPSDLNPLIAMRLRKTMELPHQVSTLEETRLSPGKELDRDFHTFVVNMDSSSSLHSKHAEAIQQRQSDTDTESVATESGILLGEQLHQDASLKIESDLEDESHFEIVGKYVISKLRTLPNIQRIYAEKLINDVLFEAELGNLSRQSNINVLG